MNMSTYSANNICDIYKIRQEIFLKKMFDRCPLPNTHASKPMCVGCASFLYYIIQIYTGVILYNMFTFLPIKYTYIHIVSFAHSKILYRQFAKTAILTTVI